MTRLSVFSSPLLLGFDELERMLDRASKTAGDGYPPYNIERLPKTEGEAERLRITLAVAGFAMLMSLLTLAAMRLPQLAPVWALGLTKGRLAALDFARTLVLAVLTLVIALPLGLVLAWALLAVVNVAAFGWRLPMAVFPYRCHQA